MVLFVNISGSRSREQKLLSGLDTLWILGESSTVKRRASCPLWHALSIYGVLSCWILWVEKLWAKQKHVRSIWTCYRELSFMHVVPRLHLRVPDESQSTVPLLYSAVFRVEMNEGNPIRREEWAALSNHSKTHSKMYLLKLWEFNMNVLLFNPWS